MIALVSLQTLKTSFNVSSDDQGSHPDDLSVSVIIHMVWTWCELIWVDFTHILQCHLLPLRQLSFYTERERSSGTELWYSLETLGLSPWRPFSFLVYHSASEANLRNMGYMHHIYPLRTIYENVHILQALLLIYWQPTRVGLCCFRHIRLLIIQVIFTH